MYSEWLDLIGFFNNNQYIYVCFAIKFNSHDFIFLKICYNVFQIMVL